MGQNFPGKLDTFEATSKKCSFKMTLNQITGQNPWEHSRRREA